MHIQATTPAQATDRTEPSPARAPAGGAAISLHFDVSLDEEHVFLSITQDQRRLDLGERVHHYALLTLARRRLADRASGIDPHSQGWIDTELLSKMLGLEAAHLNIQIFRMRRQIALAMRGAPNTVYTVDLDQIVYYLTVTNAAAGVALRPPASPRLLRCLLYTSPSPRDS